MVENNSTPHASVGSNAANQAGSFFISMKPAVSFSDQLELMKRRGLAVDDEQEALTKLSQTNYYRLRGYWLAFERNGRFLPGTTFDMIWDVYELDRELRLFMWRAIEPIEIKARTSLAYHLSMACGPNAYENPALFQDSHAHKKSMENIKRERDRALRNGVPCVKHNIEKYGALPTWAAVEIMTMGTVSQLYGNLGDNAVYDDGMSVRSAVASDFGVSPYYLKSWLRHLTYIRNICGHHSRLYNRMMTTRAKLLKSDSKYDSRKEFPTLLVLKRMYENSWPDDWNNTIAHLMGIIANHESVALGPMGFPGDWVEALTA